MGKRDEMVGGEGSHPDGKRFLPFPPPRDRSERERGLLGRKFRGGKKFESLTSLMDGRNPERFRRVAFFLPGAVFPGSKMRWW
jgi:hypothetical protein